MLKKAISGLLIATILSACTHRTANPIPISQADDASKSCSAILSEMQEMKNASLTAEGDRNAQVGKNVVLGVTGIFLLVPWFFMDTGNAATVEQRAAEARYRRLLDMANERKCSEVKAIH
ncbi:hypothetical protein [Neisseria weaveri]|uniref:hypothetical protein n=1 Tax=Neisseria weaveri TaxID=28091 RepID=UPI001F3727AA|nr:hypothetical protein [Neisseria weaveri]